MWTLLLLAATVRSFAHMPLGISDRNSTIVVSNARLVETGEHDTFWNKCTFCKLKVHSEIRWKFQTARDEYNVSTIKVFPFPAHHVPMISGFVLDYMHLRCLGVQKRILIMNMAQRWSVVKILLLLYIYYYWFIRCEISHFSWNSWG